MVTDYLDSVRKQFEYYQHLGTKTIDLLNDKELLAQPHDESNSIAIIVNHLWGNMLSRWTDFLGSDGEKEWRDRDLEFEHVIKTKADLLQKWNAGWECLFSALNTVNEANFETTIYIRNQGHTIVEAINRQLCHYAYHVGQMVFLGKLLKGADWESLSIPKGGSKTFNKKKFAQEKHDEHFTDEFLKKRDVDHGS